ncbi:MAG: aminodeoxychorismate synthase component I [Alphaproteobacteria bacterium]|nr:aminodeoxychorismate synthase component I [Alphaproteobacteria bacterium]
MEAGRLRKTNAQTAGAHVRTLAETCDLLPLHGLKRERYPFLLESASQGGPRARYDILFAFPEGELSLRPDHPLEGGFLEALDRQWRAARLQETAPPLPFTGGWFLYLGYELAGEIEPTLRLPPAGDGFPIAVATRIPAAILCDHERNETHLVAEAGRADLLDALESDLRAAANRPCRPGGGPLLAAPLHEDRAERYLKGIRRVQDYIAAGDVFQVNLSRLWKGHLRTGLTHAEIYARLRERNPAPFAGLAAFGDRAILSSSPERLVERRGTRLQTRPIAGTRPRGEDEASDRSHAQNLLAHPKERAEHVMLIDLERNDLGRVAIPGSITVDEFMGIESYAHVHHIVSNVQGMVRPETTPGQIIRAVFPGGTITGCPKVRCMEIVAELEGVGRGPYTGALGYLNRNGDMDLNILIRSILREGDGVSIRTGAGIVADSVPLRELEETRDKARGMLRALAG